MRFGLSAAMDIVAEPGTLRVALRSNRRAFWIHTAVAAIATVTVVIAMLLGSWRPFDSSSILSAFILVALWSNVGVSEAIEIDNQRLVIRRKRFGWTWTSDYPIENCTDFRANQNQSWIFSLALWCKVGGRVIKFGQDMSDDQVAQVMLELKRNLPRAADQLLMRTDITTLNLS